MPRRFRIVVPERSHHVIQRGNRCQQVFFYPQDKVIYLQLLQEQTKKHGVRVLAYCLMDNHVHLILVPETKESLAKAVAEINRRFTCMINKRYKWRGYLWQGRFLSSVMDDIYLLRALHYVENNPVRAGMVKKPWDYSWSSAQARISGGKSGILSDIPEVISIEDWKGFLIQPVAESILDDIRKRSRAGLPIAEADYIEKLAKELSIDPVTLNVRPVGRPIIGTH